MGIVAIDVDLCEYRKGDPEVQRAELLDFLVRSGFLTPELIARKSEDCEASVFVCFIELFESLVLLCEAAFAGDIDDEQDLSSILDNSCGNLNCPGEKRSKLLITNVLSS
jgi:hypothetical protein